MTLSTSSTAAADSWQDGIDRLLSQNHGPDLKFQEAIDLDEGFAMAHGCLAYWYQQRARPEEARETIKQIGRAVQQECRDRYRMPSSA